MSKLVCFLTALALLLSSVGAMAQTDSTEQVLYSFTGGSDGANPWAGVTFRDGKLYGTTLLGGYYTYGTVFELDGSTETMLHSFTGFGDGSSPQGPITFDSAGDVYGTAPNGGRYGHGLVFELMGPYGGNWILTPIYSFTGGTDGGWPNPGLVFDKAGNVYGTTLNGGTSGNGTVFQIKPAGYFSTETVLYSFGGGSDGIGPWAGAVFHEGNLYGTTFVGGPFGYGTVFKLTQSESGWTESVLHTFTGGSDGGAPRGGVVFKGSALYGTTWLGGTLGEGTAFELSAQSVETVLHNFGEGSDGALPEASVVFDKAGNLYGSTTFGGTSNAGTIFKLTPAKGGWTENILHSFTNGSDGGYPVYVGPVFHEGNIYGTASGGGTYGFGVVFEIAP